MVVMYRKIDVIGKQKYDIKLGTRQKLKKA